MARSATIIILPVIRTEPEGVDLGRQKLLPSSDRRKVVELWRVKEQRLWEGMCVEIGADPRRHSPTALALELLKVQKRTEKRRHPAADTGESP
jgi:hypothetical protein